MAEGYRRRFLSLGAGVNAGDISQIGPLTRSSIKNDTAEHYFRQTVGANQLLFHVEFVKESGVWKILEF